MKKVDRLPPPDCLNNALPKIRKKNREFYKDLYDSKGRIRPRWNTTCKNGQKISKIRTQLLAMSSYCCVYCGKNIHNGEMDVDHYLPTSAFPYLAYCWENLLPACEYCNQNTKGDFIPNSLREKKLVEGIIADEYSHDHIYDKEELLMNIAKDDRLIEPTFDNPDDHVVFDPKFCHYVAKTPIGKRTITMFFHHREVAERWKKISEFIKELVLDDTPEELVYHFIQLYGYEYVCLKFYEYWLNEKREGRLG